MGKRKKIKQVLSKESNSKPSDLRFDVYLVDLRNHSSGTLVHVYFSSLNYTVCENNRLFDKRSNYRD